MASKFKKKLKKFAKTAAKAAVIGGALYGATKLGKRGLKGSDKLTEGNIGIGQRPPRVDDYNYVPKKPKHFDPNFFAGKKGGRAGAKHGGRTGKQFGGGLGSTARRDMRSGYYPSDMGMRGGPMYKKGGRVKSMGVAKRGGGVAKK
jgi:hypothetical protein